VTSTLSSLFPRQLLERRAMGWATKLRVNPELIEFSTLPSRWGTCSPDNVVTFADDLALESEDYQDYVIVHELLHLRYKNHGKQFNAMMSALVPNWTQAAKTHSKRSMVSENQND